MYFVHASLPRRFLNRQESFIFKLCDCNRDGGTGCAGDSFQTPEGCMNRDLARLNPKVEDSSEYIPYNTLQTEVQHHEGVDDQVRLIHNATF